MGVAGEHLVTEERGAVRVRDALRPREAQVLDAVPVHQSAGADSIARTAGIGLVEVQRLLVRLHERGLVERVGSGWCLSDAAPVTATTHGSARNNARLGGSGAGGAPRCAGRRDGGARDLRCRHDHRVGSPAPDGRGVAGERG